MRPLGLHGRFESLPPAGPDSSRSGGTVHSAPPGRGAEKPPPAGEAAGRYSADASCAFCENRRDFQRKRGRRAATAQAEEGIPLAEGGITPGQKGKAEVFSGKGFRAAQPPAADRKERTRRIGLGGERVRRSPPGGVFLVKTVRQGQEQTEKAESALPPAQEGTFSDEAFSQNKPPFTLRSAADVPEGPGMRRQSAGLPARESRRAGRRRLRAGCSHHPGTACGDALPVSSETGRRSGCRRHGCPV